MRSYMLSELTIPSRVGNRKSSRLAYIVAIMICGLKLYARHIGGPWIVAILGIFIGVPLLQACARDQLVFSREPKAIQRQFVLFGISLKTEPPLHVGAVALEFI
jgi:hypothetical protein